MSYLLWILPAVVLGLVLLVPALWVLRHQRRCPSCREPMRTLPATDSEPKYEVLVCDHCPTVATLALGHQARFAYCPRCRNRSVRLPARRLPDCNGLLRVGISEQCELCGYARETVQTGESLHPHQPLPNNVIAFVRPSPAKRTTHKRQ